MTDEAGKMSRDRCHALGCTNSADPRFAIHGPDGEPVGACDGHGNPGCDGDPCTCPQHDGEVGPVPSWIAAQRRVREGRGT
jgi:hypothetical protein